MVMSCASRLLPVGASGYLFRTSIRTGVARCRASSTSRSPTAKSSSAFNSPTRGACSGSEDMTHLGGFRDRMEVGRSGGISCGACSEPCGLRGRFLCRPMGIQGGDSLKFGPSRAVHELLCGVDGCTRPRIAGVGVLEDRKNFLQRSPERSVRRHAVRPSSVQSPQMRSSRTRFSHRAITCGLRRGSRDRRRIPAAPEFTDLACTCTPSSPPSSRPGWKGTRPKRSTTDKG